MPTQMMGLVAATATTFMVLVFLQASWHRLSDLPRFHATLQQYRLLPEALVPWAVRALLLAEATCIVLLMVPVLRPLGALLAMTLLALYALSMGINLWRGRDHIDCGCGGPAQPLSWRLLLRNGMLMLMLVPVLSGPWLPLSTLDATLALFGGVLLWIGYQLIEQLGANGERIRRRQGDSSRFHFDGGRP